MAYSNKDFIEFNENILNDEPVELFPNLFIYPVQMKNYIKFLVNSSVFKIEKNKIKDPKIISMSYLEYLIHLIESQDKKESTVVTYMLYNIISLILRDENVDISYKKEKNKYYFIINNVKLNKDDFEKLRYFVLYQNIPDYKEEYINPDLENDLALADEIRNRGKHPCSIEKEEMAVVISSSLTLNDVRELTIRKFFIALEMINKKMEYIMLKTASLSGFVEFKEEILHYLVEKDTSLEDSVIDYQQFKNKISV